MNAPRVSVCLPNLNNRPYLEERIATIEAQTFKDWELVICDNHSDDGAWEFFQELAKRDSRVLLSQEPREGMYANWNNCVRKARGEFVYVATSDDTMAEDCLEKMVKALDENPDCDLAHCPMKVIDQHGAPGRDWWTVSSHFTKSSGIFLKQRHKRVAPFDGVLCLLGDNIYSSVTQLLIRRSLYDKVGLYKADWGSLGDFHWNLRAGLAASAVHVPDTWGGWRMHPSQATAAVGLNSPDHQAKIDAMIDDVLAMWDAMSGKGSAACELQGAGGAGAGNQVPSPRACPPDECRWSGGCFFSGGRLLGKRAARQHLASLISGSKWPKGAPAIGELVV